MCIGLLWACAHVYNTCEGQKRVPGSVVIVVVTYVMWVLGSELGPLQEKCMSSTTEPSL